MSFIGVRNVWQLQVEEGVSVKAGGHPGDPRIHEDGIPTHRSRDSVVREVRVVVMEEA